MNSFNIGSLLEAAGEEIDGIKLYCAIGFVIFLVSFLIPGATLASAFIPVCWVYIALCKHHGDHLTWKTFFKPYDKFIQMFLASIIISIASLALLIPTIISIYLNIIFGIFIMLICLTLTYFVAIIACLQILYGNKKVMSACADGIKLVFGNFKVFLFSIISFLLILCGLISIIGWIWVIPWVSMSWALIYKKYFIEKSQPSEIIN